MGLHTETLLQKERKEARVGLGINDGGIGTLCGNHIQSPEKRTHTLSDLTWVIIQKAEERRKRNQFWSSWTLCNRAPGTFTTVTHSVQISKMSSRKILGKIACLWETEWWPACLLHPGHRMKREQMPVLSAIRSF